MTDTGHPTSAGGVRNAFEGREPEASADTPWVPPAPFRRGSSPPAQPGRAMPRRPSAAPAAPAALWLVPLRRSSPQPFQDTRQKLVPGCEHRTRPKHLPPGHRASPPGTSWVAVAAASTKDKPTSPQLTNSPAETKGTSPGPGLQEKPGGVCLPAPAPQSPPRSSLRALPPGDPPATRAPRGNLAVPAPPLLWG